MWGKNFFCVVFLSWQSKSSSKRKSVGDTSFFHFLLHFHIYIYIDSKEQNEFLPLNLLGFVQHRSLFSLLNPSPYALSSAWINKELSQVANNMGEQATVLTGRADAC